MRAWIWKAFPVLFFPGGAWRRRHSVFVKGENSKGGTVFSRKSYARYFENTLCPVGQGRAPPNKKEKAYLRGRGSFSFARFLISPFKKVIPLSDVVICVAPICPPPSPFLSPFCKRGTAGGAGYREGKKKQYGFTEVANCLFSFFSLALISQGFLRH